MPTPEELKLFLEDTIKNPKYIAHDGLTFCNHFVQDVFSHFGYQDFKGLTANQIFDYCEKSENFKEWQPLECAHLVARHGILCVAAIKGNPHGHVAIVFPGIPVLSKKWGQEVPLVVSTGKQNGIKGANWFFGDIPTFFMMEEKE